ncbi:MAG: hypothetical protein WAM28_05705, partial [Chlamydiales bacterium]
MAYQPGGITERPNANQWAEANEGERRGSFGEKVVTAMTYLTPTAIFVLGCLTLNSTLSGVVVGASAVGLSGVLFFSRALSSWLQSSEGERSIAPTPRSKVVLVGCGYAALVGALGATGMISASTLGYTLILPVMAIAGPIIATCCCCCGCALSFIPCCAAIGAYLFGGPDNETRDPSWGAWSNFEDVGTRLRSFYRGGIQGMQASSRNNPS